MLPGLVLIHFVFKVKGFVKAKLCTALQKLSFT